MSIFIKQRNNFRKGMNMKSKKVKEMWYCYRQTLCIIIALCVALPQISGMVALASEGGNIHHYKLLSSIEYNGKGQFCSQAETVFTVQENSLSENQVKYVISGKEIDWADPNSIRETKPIEISFVVDRNTHRLSGTEKNLGLLELVNNRCVKELNTAVSENVGKEWEQSFDLSFLGDLLPNELKFK